MQVLFEAIAAGDGATASQLLARSPDLALARADVGATRHNPVPFFLKGAQCYVYEGMTALHAAAATYSVALVEQLVALGAVVRARTRRGAQPLHYAASGGPGSALWDPESQAATVWALVRAGADLEAVDLGGITPLHRAVRCRCAAAVEALLEAGSDPSHLSKRGTTTVQTPTTTKGTGGAGSPAAKKQNSEILELFRRRGLLA
mgnify:CR=1 FL=1